jgi:hypothetical protein
MAYCA